MPITKKDSQELDQFYAEYRNRYHGRKEDYFALVYLTKKFKCPVETIAHQIAFGGSESGIDAYFIDREGKNLYLFQFKWSENHNAFKESLDRITKEGMELIFGTTPIPKGAGQNDFLRHLKADIKEHQSIIDRVYIQFVFKGSLDSAENSAGLDERLENLQNKKYFFENVFGERPVELIPEFISDFKRKDHSPIVDTFTIPFVDKVSTRIPDSDKSMFVGFVSLMDLHRIHQAIGQRFFDRNIRAGLSPENSPNRKIREALADIVLKQKDPPEVFSFNHNGITLAAEQILFEEKSAVIKVPRLLNGAQTITSVAKFLKDNEGSPAINKKALEAIHVLAKIVEYDPQSDFVTNVTICNNRQNPVDPWNLRANDRIQCDLQDKFNEDVGIFYSRQENSFSNLSELELQEMGIQEHRDIKIKPLAQTFCAVQGEIDRISRISEIFENSKYYEDTFKDSYLKCDTRKIVLAYKVHLVLNSPMQRLEERISDKLAYPLSRARNWVWALMIQSLFNDPMLADYLDQYGRTLARETGFRELLKNIASGKILHILREVLLDEGYQQKISEEKYSFLRTKEIFKRSMDVAYAKYSWVKRSF